MAGILAGVRAVSEAVGDVLGLSDVPTPRDPLARFGVPGLQPVPAAEDLKVNLPDLEEMREQCARMRLLGDYSDEDIAERNKKRATFEKRKRDNELASFALGNEEKDLKAHAAIDDNLIRMGIAIKETEKVVDRLGVKKRNSEKRAADARAREERMEQNEREQDERRARETARRAQEFVFALYGPKRQRATD
jgi:hypothetical protein